MRDVFSQRLETLRSELVRLSGMVQQATARASNALLEADLQQAEQVVNADFEVDALRERIEEDAFQLLSLQNPVATDLRTLVAALAMAGELERIGDLAVHVARIARLRAPDSAVPQEIAPTIHRMATVAELMVGRVGQIIASSDVAGAAALEEIDQEMDRLRRDSFTELLDPNWACGVEPAVDVALLGRYYERIADHAVSVARRVAYLVTGELPQL
ncbi:MAG TPA: phosphate signaling complex protein PhoU [Marmoricola sp.]|nr:phosphate signaling complex protein PhoU [Marmoricola sp.]